MCFGDTGFLVVRSLFFFPVVDVTSDLSYSSVSTPSPILVVQYTSQPYEARRWLGYQAGGLWSFGAGRHRFECSSSHFLAVQPEASYFTSLRIDILIGKWA